MSKNMTRRSTAIAGAAALAIASLTAAPAANAAETLALAPSAGAEYAALTTSSFVLDAGFSGTESTAAQGALKFRVINDGDAALTVGIVEGDDTSNLGYKYGTTSSPELDTNDYATSDDDFVVYSKGGDPAIGATQSISLEPSAGFTSDITLTVQAFLDLDGGNDVDSSEPTSPVRTVTFYAAKNVTGTATLESLTLNGTSMTANVTYSPALNVRQLDTDDVRVRFLENNSTAAVDNGGAATDDTTLGYFAASYDSTEKVVDADLTGLATNIATGTTYGAQVYFFDGNGTTEADYDKSGSAAYSSASSGQVATLDAVAIRASNTVTSSLIREGSGTFTVEADVATVTSGNSVAGQTVTFTITDSALTSGASVTAGGKTLTSADTSISVDAVSAANGEAEIEISYSGFDADDGDAITINATALGASAVIQSGGNSSVDLTMTAHASTGDFVVDSIAGAKQVESVIGVTQSVSYTVVDEFGQTPDGTLQLVISENGTGSFAGTVAITNGTGTWTWVENSPSANDYTLTATLQKKDSNGVFGNVAGPVTETTAISAVTAAQVPASITNTANDDGSSTEIPLTLASQATMNSEISQASASAPTDDTGAWVSGTVSSSNGTPLKGVAVTLKSTGNVMFTSEDEFSYGVGALTVRTNTSGVYKAFVSSNSAGKQTITATAGSVSKDEVIEFAAAAANTGTDIVWTGTSATSTSGSTFKYVVTLNDKYGNPVKTDGGTPNMLVSYTGPGLTIPTTLPTNTDANGQLTVSVLLGANDSADGTLSVGYSLDADSNATDDNEFTESYTVDVNPVAAQKVNAGSFKGYVAVYARGYEGQRLSAKIGNDWVIVDPIVNNQENGTLFRVTDFTGAGVDIAVRIYIDRVLIDTINLTTK